MKYKEFPGFLAFSTDGSCLHNGKEYAIAGTGVYFGPNDPRNYGEPLGPGRQTNQRAELNGLLKGFSIIPLTQDALCESDSVYALMCVTTWYFRWELKSWRKPQGIRFENLDLIEPIVKLLEDRRQHGAQTLFRWVKGHSGNPGNEAADRLAAQGARKEHIRRYNKQPEESWSSLARSDKNSVFMYTPFGFKEIRHASGRETLERLSEKTLEYIREEQKEKAAARKARAEKYKNKRNRGSNKAERLALKEAHQKRAAASSESVIE